MSGVIALIILLACIFFLFGCGKREYFASNLLAGKSEQNKALSRKLLESRLEKLSFTPAPGNLNMGAMCYKVAMNVKRIEFVCPVCGEKTIYPEKSHNAIYINNQLEKTRREIKKMKSFDIKLDETQFCKKCSPKTKNPKLFLVINYSDAKPSKVQIKNYNDIVLLREFLEGKIVHKYSSDRETPLRQHLPRIKELLGIK